MKALTLVTCLLALFVIVSSTTAADVAPDAGFTLLFNGQDLSGWVTKKEGTSLEKLTESPTKRFKASDGNLIIDEKVKGDMIINTTRELGKDTHLKFEFMPGPGCNNDLFLHGMKFDIKKNDIKNLKEGEWNTFEIIIHNHQAEFKSNGETIKSSPTKIDSSPFGIRAEFGPIQFRKIQVKESP